MFGKPKLLVIFLSAIIVLYGLVGGLLENVAAGDDVYGQLDIFSSVLSKLENEYVERPDLGRAMNGALLGMIEAVDPFSSFVESSVFEELQPQASQQASPGMRLSKRLGYAYVVSVEPGSSADRVGLRSGDLVESVEGRVTTEMSLWEVAARLKGRQGTNVTIRVVRARRAEPMEMNLERTISEPDSVKGTVIEDGIGILDIPNFAEGVVEDVAQKVRLLSASGVKGLLVDLRGTTGGELREATAVADLFLAKETSLVSVVGREGTQEEIVAQSDPVDATIPLVLLVDGGTSGPAEVLATALVDQERATAVGLRTNGHGSLQQRFDLADGSVVFLATRLLVRKDGVPLQGKTVRSSGLRPTVRAPRPDFVTSFYFEHMNEGIEGPELEEFYRQLDEAIEREQVEKGLEAVREQVLRKAA